MQDAFSMQRKIFETYGVKAADLATALEQFPETIIPPHRKERSYWSAILALNERENEKGKKFLYRHERGIYLLNPAMEILLKDVPVKISEHLKYDSKDIFDYDDFYEGADTAKKQEELVIAKEVMQQDYINQKLQKERQRMFEELRRKEQRDMWK